MDDLFEQGQKTGIVEPARQLCKQDCVIDAGEVTLDVDFCVPGKTAREMLSPVNGGNRSFADTASERVVNEQTVNPFTGQQHDCVMQNAISE